MQSEGSTPSVTRQAPVPLFPLPNVFLIPGALLPLQIFEPRYRQMTQDLLDGKGTLILATLDPTPAAAGAPAPIEDVGGLGVLEGYQKLPDGRFIVLVRGLSRVRIHEVTSAKPYRLASYEIPLEVPVSGAEAAELETQLRAAIAKRSGESPPVPAGVAISQLVDLLVLHLKLPVHEMCDLFRMNEVAERARRALEAHATHSN